eukprot:3547186-Amphidinium_carterae.2
MAQDTLCVQGGVSKQCPHSCLQYICTIACFSAQCTATIAVWLKFTMTTRNNVSSESLDNLRHLTKVPALNVTLIFDVISLLN